MYLTVLRGHKNDNIIYPIVNCKAKDIYGQRVEQQ